MSLKKNGLAMKTTYWDGIWFRVEPRKIYKIVFMYFIGAKICLSLILKFGGKFEEIY